MPVMIVCLPEPTTPVDELVDTALDRMDPDAQPAWEPIRYFRTRRRWRTAKLVSATDHTSAGGPIGLLDLQAMFAAGHATYAWRYQVWQQVVAGTPPAQPYWRFWDRHRDQPRRYPLAQAQRDYLAQPRVVAMRVYTMLDNRVTDLPDAHLEALQTSSDTYAHLGGLTAVAAQKMIDLPGHLLAPATDRLHDLLTYLDTAHTHLRELSARHQLVALYRPC